MDINSVTFFFDTYKLAIISFVVMVLLAFVLIRLTLSLRTSAEKELEQLQYSNPALYVERLQNNRRLTWVFRKNETLLMQLDGQMRLGQDEQIQRLIATLDAQRLLPREKVDYLQKRMSFFASIGDVEEAKASFEKLEIYLRSVKADQVKRYRIMLEEGEEIIQVYLDKNPDYRVTLQSKLTSTTNPIQKGIRLYRLAKLSWYARDEVSARAYLDQAKPLLAGSDYAPIIEQAEEDLSILAIK
jgi:hypothetical protein